MKIVLFALSLLSACPLLLFAGDIEEGKSIFEARCGICHQHPEPAMLKPEQWRRLLETKQKLMEKAGMTPLSDYEFKQVLEFVMNSSKK